MPLARRSGRREARKNMGVQLLAGTFTVFGVMLTRRDRRRLHHDAMASFGEIHVIQCFHASRHPPGGGLKGGHSELARRLVSSNLILRSFALDCVCLSPVSVVFRCSARLELNLIKHHCISVNLAF